MEVIGPAAFKLFASIDQDDTNWIVKFSDVGPSGGEEPDLGKGYLKASHRALDLNKSTDYAPYHKHTKVEPVKPGEVIEYVISLGKLTNIFRAGHRIKLVIESMESPRDPEILIHYHSSAAAKLRSINYRNKDIPSHLSCPCE